MPCCDDAFDCLIMHLACSRCRVEATWDEGVKSAAAHVRFFLCDPLTSTQLALTLKTRGFTGADLENLCRSAGVFANARGATAVSCDDLAAVTSGWISGVLVA